MYYPTINGATPQKVSFDSFGGLNRSYACGDSEFADMENMTGDDFPCVSVRGKRQEMQGPIDGEKLDFIVADNENATQYNGDTGIKLTEDSFRYFYRGEEKDVYKSTCFEVDKDSSAMKDITYLNYPIGNKINGFVRFGNNLIKYPYPEIVNKIRNANNGKEQEITTGDSFPNQSISRGAVAFGLYFNPYTSSTKSREYFKIRPYKGNKEDSYFENGYLITVYTEGASDDPPYRDLVNKEVITPGTRLRIEEYATADGVKRLTGNDLEAAFFVVVSVDSDSLFVRGYKQDGTELVNPDLNYICTHEMMAKEGTGVLVTKLLVDANLLAVHQNRLWGTDTLGTSIYCSDATDIYHWEVDGTAAGGGFVDVPENSPWTALYSYNGYLYAFKANKMYKIMGSTALEYAAISLCEIGCTNQEAVCVSESVMYFLSEDGVYAFTGNLPVKISGPLAESYVRGHLAGDSGKVYASLTKKDGTTEFLVYDTEKRLWHKEDDLAVRSYVNYAGELYALAEDKTTYKLTGGSPDGVPFSLTTKKYFYLFDKKAVSYVNLYTETEGEDAKLDVFVSYDGKEFELVAENVQDRRVKIVPVRLKKCDTFQFKLSGVGGVRLRQIEFVLHTGGEPRR